MSSPPTNTPQRKKNRKKIPRYLTKTSGCLMNSPADQKSHPPTQTSHMEHTLHCIQILVLLSVQYFIFLIFEWKSWCIFIFSFHGNTYTGILNPCMIFPWEQEEMRIIEKLWKQTVAFVLELIKVISPCHYNVQYQSTPDLFILALSYRGVPAPLFFVDSKMHWNPNVPVFIILNLPKKQ